MQTYNSLQDVEANFIHWFITRVVFHTLKFYKGQ
jgi:hypothetical protein